MAYNPVSGAAIQYMKANGQVASDYWLKFYIANTTTPLSMAADATGAALLVKCKLNDKGYPITNESDNNTVFIPYVNQDYRFVIYRSDTGADSNDTDEQEVNIPSVSSLVGADTSIIESIASVSNLSGLVGVVGQQISVASYRDGWAVVGDGLPVGGGKFAWGPGTHNGGTFIDPNRTHPTPAEWAVGSSDPAVIAWFDLTGGVVDGWRRLDTNSCNFYCFGLLADGITDDTLAFTRWINTVKNPKNAAGSIRLTSSVLVTSPTKWIAASPDETKIIPDLGTSGGKILAFETNDVHVENIGIDGTGLNYTLTGNQYCIYGGDGSTKFKNHTYKNNKITDVISSDGLTGLSNLLVSHGIYIDNVDNVKIKRNEINGTSGAAIFLRDINELSVKFNDCIDNAWYPIHINGGLFNFAIDRNNILQTLTNGVFYGGGIDMMNQHIPLQTRSRDGTISYNHFEGVFSYGAIIRCFSCENVDIKGNTGRNLSSGLVAIQPDITMIRVGTRGTVAGSENGPAKNITVESNVFQCPETAGDHRGVYCDNQFQTARVFSSGITVINNRMLKSDVGTAFAGGYLFHGNDGGIEEIICENNYAETEVNGTQPVLGGIGFIANSAQGKIIGANVGGNIIVNQGTPTTSAEIGFNVGAYVDRVTTTKLNRLDNFYYTLRTFTNSGPTLEYLNNLQAEGVVATELLLGVPLSKYADLGEIRTSTQLDDITDSINTNNKWEGKRVFNSTANKPVYATSGTAAATWNDGAGANTNNPV